MPIKHAIWKVGTQPTPLGTTSLGNEQQLEDMIVREPNILSSEWMLIGRQEITPFGGRVDLLGIAPDGSLVLIELKRNRTPREIVAQALDYAAWVDGLTADKIAQIYQRYSKGGNLDEAFQQHFGTTLDEETLNDSHQIILVAAELDDATERIITYLGRIKWAWLIKGKSMGQPLPAPVVIPPIASFLDKKMFHRRTIIRIPKEVFNSIKKYTQTHRFDPKKIPCLGREPRCEQEVVAIIASGHRQFGIEKILRIQTRFPDMLVKIRGKAEPVHLELELYSSSFNGHGHSDQVRARRFTGDRNPIGVLCWIDDDREGLVKRRVHRVFELQALLREGRVLRW